MDDPFLFFFAPVSATHVCCPHLPATCPSTLAHALVPIGQWANGPMGQVRQFAYISENKRTAGARAPHAEESC